MRSYLCKNRDHLKSEKCMAYAFVWKPPNVKCPMVQSGTIKTMAIGLIIIKPFTKLFHRERNIGTLLQILFLAFSSLAGGSLYLFIFFFGGGYSHSLSGLYPSVYCAFILPPSNLPCCSETINMSVYHSKSTVWRTTLPTLCPLPTLPKSFS